MKVAERTLTRLFILVEPEVAAILSFETVQKKYESILESVGSEEDKCALSYVLWQLFQERRWTPHLLSRLVVIYLLYANIDRLPEEGRNKVVNAFLQAYLETSSEFDEQERILMGRLVLNDGKLSPATLCCKLDDGLHLDQIEYADNDKLVDIYERVQRKLSNRHVLDRGRYSSVIASNDLNPKLFRYQNDFNRIRRAYFAQISAEDGPLYRTFTPEVIHITPGVLSPRKEMGVLVPDIFDFPYLLWDNTLDDLVCDSPESRELLRLSGERSLEIDEHRDLISWIAQVLEPIDKPRFVFREPQLLKRFGFSANLLINIADKNPQVAIDILKHAIHQYDMTRFIHNLIYSFHCSNDVSLLANRFEVIKQLLQFADMPTEYVQLFLVNSLDICEKHPDLCSNLGRKMCLLVLRMMDDPESTESERTAVRNICDYIENFCVQLRDVEEAITVYSRIRSFSMKTEETKPVDEDAKPLHCTSETTQPTVAEAKNSETGKGKKKRSRKKRGKH